MIYSKKRPYLIPAVIIFTIAVLLVLNALIKPDLSIKTFCEVLPKQKWMLTRGTNGQVISSMIDYTNGYTSEYSLNQFERGEYVTLDFVFNRKGRRYVAKGDTILSIISSDVDERLNSAEGDLQVAKATFKSLSAGEKAALLKEAESRLIYNAKQIETQRILAERLDTLYKKGLGAQQEYELQKWLLDLYEIERGIYQAQLENLQTGVKQEERDVVATQVNSLETSLNILRSRKKNLVLTSPISGSIGTVFSPDTLLSLINDKEIVLHAAVKVEDIELIKIGQTVKLNLTDFKKDYSGEVFSITREVKMLNGQQVVFVSILLNNDDGKLIPGMVKEGFFEIRKMTLFEYLLKFITA